MQASIDWEGGLTAHALFPLGHQWLRSWLVLVVVELQLLVEVF